MVVPQTAKALGVVQFLVVHCRQDLYLKTLWATNYILQVFIHVELRTRQNDGMEAPIEPA